MLYLLDITSKFCIIICNC